MDTFMSQSNMYQDEMNKKSGGKTTSFIDREQRESFANKAESKYAGVDVALSGEAYKYDVLKDDAQNELAELRGMKARYDDISPWNYVGQAIGDIIG
jgi:hypothetical protein